MIRRLVKKVKNRIFPPKHHEWFRGNYSSWEDALKDAEGYDSPEILEKVKNALLKVKNGEAIYERDSYLFDRVEYSWPLLAVLLNTALQNQSKLSLIDFGGSLGSSYFQNLTFLNSIENLQWNIVEQQDFVSVGIKHFQNHQLRFYETIESVLSIQNCDLILLSGVIQYLPDPKKMIQSIIDLQIKNVVFDRTPFWEENLSDHLTVQHTPKTISDSSYPAWFFKKTDFIEHFLKRGYRLAIEEKSFERWQVGKDHAQNYFLYFKKNGS
ncbi:methyltransferase, TIGR04325 family [Leptospira yanagawae serovar Saopaulo str. Sao Paulo = ATCC 700523]|uniref:Methyltransferase, TIGR04325 family n=2 Tax=Leptospira yanagawae TaxID=293069 RepID=A0A5E8HAR0_9LEPT|nr:methyltransferase, TIGR04325 family [Leptospira yanagawae]EOQ88355.1 methyltransferase, TIGR04325 family [Leptospira yanagawae serovar Saopaulo str. Sao Paulo = ATCC 700523]